MGHERLLNEQKQANQQNEAVNTPKEDEFEVISSNEDFQKAYDEVEAEKAGEFAEATEKKEEAEQGENAGEPEKEQQQEQQQGEQPKKKNRAEKRIKKLIAEKYRLKAELEALKAKLADGTEPKDENEEPASEDEPQPEDFESYEEYLEALEEFDATVKDDDIETAADEKEARKKEAAEKATEAGIDPDFAVALETIKELAEEREEAKVLFEDETIPITPDMVVAIAETESPIDVALYIAENRAEGERIAKLSPRQQAIEIGKLEAKLALLKTKPTKKITSARQGVEPVTGGGSTIGMPMDYNEYEKWRNAQERDEDII